MAATRCSVVCFSPTGTTRKIAKAVAEGCDLPVTMHDLTLPRLREGPALSFAESDLVILAVPVYFGRVPRTAAAVLAAVKGHGTPAVLVVNYGNRHYDDSLLELQDMAREAGFVPVAAGAFVSQHSYHTDAYPMAPGRPDKHDLETAADFGGNVMSALGKAVQTELSLPGNRPHRPYPDMYRAPVTTDACTRCAACAKVCPTGAITINADGVNTDEKNCIMCQACVATCPAKARQDAAPGAKELRERLAPMVKNRREAEVFFACAD